MGGGEKRGREGGRGKRKREVRVCGIVGQAGGGEGGEGVEGERGGCGGGEVGGREVRGGDAEERRVVGRFGARIGSGPYSGPRAYPA